MSRTKPKGFTIIATLSLVMFLLGLLGILLINASILNAHIKNNITITVFFESGMQDATAQSLGDSILSLPFAAQGQFISSEEAVFNFKNEIGEDFVDLLGNSPLPASLEVGVKKDYADEISLLQVERNLSQMDGVLEVTYPQNVFQQIDKNRRAISLWIVVISIILVFFSIVLMVNTIRILVYSDRFIIKNQQLIGATERFILKPYLKKAFWWTILSFAIGVLLLAAVLVSIFSWLSTSMDINTHAIAQHFIQNWYQYILMLFLLLVGGALVIFIATYLTAKKYLQAHTDTLYT